MLHSRSFRNPLFSTQCGKGETDGYMRVDFESENTVYVRGKNYVLFGSLLGLVDEYFVT